MTQFNIPLGNLASVLRENGWTVEPPGRARRDIRLLNDRDDEYNGQASIDDYMKRHTKDK